MTSSTLLPHTWTLQNYRDLFASTSTAPIFKWLMNTAVVTVSGTILRITTSVLAAYALARLPVPGKRFIVVGLVWAMAIPEIVTFLQGIIILLVASQRFLYFLKQRHDQKMSLKQAEAEEGGAAA